MVGDALESSRFAYRLTEGVTALPEVGVGGKSLRYSDRGGAGGSQGL